MSNQPPKHSSAPPALPGKAPHPDVHSWSDKDDDTLHVPKGVSKGTFYFLIGLVILLMLIWLVPGAISSMAGGTNNPVVVRFTLPSGEKVEWKATDVLLRQRAVQDALQTDFFLTFQFGGKLEKEDVTRILVLDRIAEDSGVEVTNADLAAHLRSLLEMTGRTPDDFKNIVRAQGFDQTTVENSIRRLLRVSRFLQLVGFAGAVPDPAKIEEQWHEDNEEFAFDYVALDTSALTEEARAALPDDAGLQAWFDALDEGEKAEFRTDERRKAQAALFRDAETTPAAELLAAYPEKPPEGAAPTAPDELALQYYNRVYSTRFAKEPSPEDDPGTPPGFQAFDEVKDAALAEAPVYFAMQRWIEDVNARAMNGETVDFAAEAPRLGLEHQAFPDALSQKDYAAAEGMGEGVADAVFGAPPDGSLYPLPVPLERGLAVVRVDERVEPELPAFETIRDRAAEKWIEPKARELALARLKTLRDGLERFEPAKEEDEDLPPQQKKKVHYRASAEAFRAAAQAAGLEVATRDYLNRGSRDTLPDDPDQRTLFQQANTMGLYQLHADEVAEPALGSDQERAYLVRLAGRRPVPIEQMSPSQYDGYKRSLRGRAVAEIGNSIDLDFLRKNYGLWLFEDDVAAQQGAGAGSAGGAGSGG